MKKTNKSENWFIPLVFASIGQKYLFNLFDFNYNVFKESFDIAKEEYSPINEQIIALLKVDIKELEKQLKAIGAPYTPGRLDINH